MFHNDCRDERSSFVTFSLSIYLKGSGHRTDSSFSLERHPVCRV